MAFLKVRSKNETANALRRQVNVGRRDVILRLGSTTPLDRIRLSYPDQAPIEINTVQASINSGDKKKMKELFAAAGIKTAPYKMMSDFKKDEMNENWNYPFIIKHRHSSQGNGIFYIEKEADIDAFVADHAGQLGSYIIEQYYTYSKEYRIHVTADGYFYTCRKMLKRDAEERWHRHDNNSVWILEENELFAKPQNWDEIVAECVKAMQAVGLDVCAVDLKCQKHEDRPVEFIILETNSGPSLGEITTVKYLEMLKNKYGI